MDEPLHRIEHCSDEDALVKELAGGIRRRRVILFAGAGVSAELGLPSWETFIGGLGSELGFDTEDFLGLSHDFRSLAEYYRLEKGSIEALRERVVREWTVADEALAASRVHQLIVRLKFPLIYTTNYDHLLERAFALHGQRVNKATTAKDIARGNPKLPTIVKFHGDLDDGGSLVLTETDYFRRLAFEHALDIMLTADALSRAVLFVGYSVSDVNLRLLLFRLRQIWLDSGHTESRPRSYVVMEHPNPVQQRILASWGVTPLIAGDGEDDGGLVPFLERLCALVESSARA